MTELKNVQLFATQPHACSYLPEQDATTLFVDPNIQIDAKLYSDLSELGFRRSGKHVYRPRCTHCQACIPIRIPVDCFSMTRQQKRCWRRNQDLSVTRVVSINTREHYELYAHYIEARHRDGDMYPPSRQQFRDFLTSEWGVTRYYEFRQNHELIACAVCDHIESGLSAIYTYFKPQLHKRSLGAYAILYQIHLAQELGLPYLYLGYWIKACQKMLYKTDYRPFELMINQHWVMVK